MDVTLLPPAFMGPIEYYAKLIRAEQGADIRVEQWGTYHKQTYANRAIILGPNGVQNLIVPVEKPEQHTPLCQVRISYRDNWPEQHLRTIKTAYSPTPYYDYYIDSIARVYAAQPALLIELCREMELTMLRLIDLEHIAPQYTTEWTEEGKRGINDLRFVLNPKKKDVTLRSETEEQYYHVFRSSSAETRQLSLLDLIMELGPESRQYLRRIDKQQNKQQFYGNS